MHMNDATQTEFSRNKIVLGLLPFWTPLIPPQGIGALKVFVEKHGFRVKTMDANIETYFRNVYTSYFNTLTEFIPAERRGNFYNIGHDILENHLMAHINHTDEQAYRNLVKEVIYNIFFTPVDDELLNRLEQLVAGYFKNLEHYIVQLIEAEKPGVFGLTAYSHTLSSCLFAFRLVKERYPQIITVMGGDIFLDRLSVGGPDYQYLLEKTEKYIDKIIIGEGQILFLKFLQRELPESQRVYTIDDIERKVLLLEEEELPDLSDFVMDSYPYLGVIGSKSCPFNCSFCAGTVYFGEYRKKIARQIVSEMELLHRKYNNQIFFMCDALLNPVIDDLSSELVNADFTVYFDGYFRVDEPSGDINNTIRWRQGGFYRARLGIESGSQHVLDMIGKGITVEQSKATLANLAEAGIKTTAYLIAGHPGETEEDLQQTLDFIEEMKDSIYQIEVNPFRFYYSGQPNSSNWEKDRTPLYSEGSREMLLYQTWIVNGTPTHREKFDRLARIVEHCNRLGVPNPYSFNEIYEADKRWKRLHKNAVPSLVDLKDRDIYVDECKHIQLLRKAELKGIDEIDFDF